jgi:hypothetical protein
MCLATIFSTSNKPSPNQFLRRQKRLPKVSFYYVLFPTAKAGYICFKPSALLLPYLLHHLLLFLCHLLTWEDSLQVPSRLGESQQHQRTVSNMKGKHYQYEKPVSFKNKITTSTSTRHSTHRVCLIVKFLTFLWGQIS